MSLLISILCLAACQPAALPTQAVLPTAAPSQAAVLSSPVPPAATSPTANPGPRIASPTVTITPALPASPTVTLTATPSPAGPSVVLIGTPIVETPTPLAPAATATLLPDAFQFGQTVEGRPLLAYRYGTGPHIVLLVGGIHTGFEANTVRLMRELQDHYTRSPQAIPPHVSLLIVPVLNADGLDDGRQLSGRFNARGVDLNRNWACGWSERATFQDQAVNPGAAPFSEPESQALGALIQQSRPSAVLFYHAAARGVFPGNCEGFVSLPLAATYSAGSGYPYQAEFVDYGVTGSASAWVDSQGIPAADIELSSSTETEVIDNVRGLDAVMGWVGR